MTLVAFGRAVEHNLKAADELEKSGISAEVLSCLACAIACKTCSTMCARSNRLDSGLACGRGDSQRRRLQPAKGRRAATHATVSKHEACSLEI